MASALDRLLLAENRRRLDDDEATTDCMVTLAGSKPKPMDAATVFRSTAALAAGASVETNKDLCVLRGQYKHKVSHDILQSFQRSYLTSNNCNYDFHCSRGSRGYRCGLK